MSFEGAEAETPTDAESPEPLDEEIGFAGAETPEPVKREMSQKYDPDAFLYLQDRAFTDAHEDEYEDSFCEESALSVSLLQAETPEPASTCCPAESAESAAGGSVVVDGKEKDMDRMERVMQEVMLVDSALYRDDEDDDFAGMEAANDAVSSALALEEEEDEIDAVRRKAPQEAAAARETPYTPSFLDCASPDAVRDLCYEADSRSSTPGAEVEDLTRTFVSQSIEDARESADNAQLEAVKRTVCTALVTACHSGGLENALRLQIDEAVCKAVKQRACRILHEGAASGDLEVAVLRNAEYLEAASAVRSALQTACHSGELENALRQQRDQARYKAVTQRACRVLHEAAGTGDLDVAVLKSAEAMEAERLQNACRTVLDVAQAKVVDAKPKPQEAAPERGDGEADPGAYVCSDDADAGICFFDGDQQVCLEDVLDEANKQHQLLTDGLEKLAPSKTEPDADALRQRALRALMEASSSGRLRDAAAAIRKSAATTEVENIRQKALQALMESGSSGNLAQAIARSTVDELRNRAASALLDASSSGKLGYAVSEMKNSGAQAEVEEIRQKALARLNADPLRHRAAKALMDANSSGKLKEAVADMTKSVASAEVEEIRQKALARLNADPLRHRAAKALMDANSSGKLKEAVADMTKSVASAEVEDIRENALRKLSDSSSSGHLSKTVAKLNVDALRQRASRELYHACASGKLRDAVAEIRSRATAEVEEIRQKALRALTVSTSSHLEGAVARLSADDLRQRAVLSLMVARSSGKLTDAVSAMRRCGASAKVEGIRQKALQAVTESTSSGQLEAVVARVDAGALRQKAARELMDASSSGKLKFALAELRQSEPLADMEETRQRALIALTDSSISRHFNGAIAGLDDDAIRQKASRSLMDSRSSGKLAHAVADIKKAGAPAEVEEIRQNALRKLRDSSSSGHLSKAVAKVNVDALRQRASRELYNACASGKLGDALTDMRKCEAPVKTEEIRQKAVGAPTEPSSSDQLAKVPIVDRAVSLRPFSLYYQNYFASSANKTMICELFPKQEHSRSQVPQPAAQPLVPQPPSSPPPKRPAPRAVGAVGTGRPTTPPLAGDVRQRAVRALLDASSCGKLASALARMRISTDVCGSAESPTSVNDLRRRAVSGLVMSNSNGTLAQAGARLNVDALRSRAAGMLITAKSSGELGDAVLDMKMSIVTTNQEGLRQEALRSLTESTSSGRLGNAVASLHADALRQSAASSLVEASSTGKLGEAIAEMRKAAAPAMVEEIRQNAIAKLSADALRQRTVLALTSANSSGKLAEAVTEMRKSGPSAVAEVIRQKVLQTLTAPRSGLDDKLRQRAASALVEASSTGKLGEAVAEMRKAAAPAMVEVIRQNAIAKLNADALRQRTVLALTSANSSGKLAEAVTEMRKSGPSAVAEVIRQKALQTLTVPSSGLDDNMGLKSASLVRSQAREAEGARSGSRPVSSEVLAERAISSILAEQREQELMEKTRARVYEALQDGLEAGKLQAFIAKETSAVSLQAVGSVEEKSAERSCEEPPTLRELNETRELGVDALTASGATNAETEVQSDIGEDADDSFDALADARSRDFQQQASISVDPHGGQSNERPSDLELANVDSPDSRLHDHWEVPERANVIYFKTPWDERFYRAVMRDEFEGEESSRSRMSAPRQRRPPTGYSLRLHHCRQEALAHELVYGPPKDDSIDVQSVMGSSTRDEQVPAAILDMTETSACSQEPGDLSASELSPCKPPGPLPTSSRPVRARLRATSGSAAEVEPWPPMRGSASSAQLTPKPPAEPASTETNRPLKLSRPRRPGTKSHSRCVLNFPMKEDDDSNYVAEMPELQLSAASVPVGDGEFFATLDRLRGACGSAGTGSARSMPPLRRTPGWSSEWVTQNAMPTRWRFAPGTTFLEPVPVQTQVQSNSSSQVQLPSQPMSQSQSQSSLNAAGEAPGNGAGRPQSGKQMSEAAASEPGSPTVRAASHDEAHSPLSPASSRQPSLRQRPPSGTKPAPAPAPVPEPATSITEPSPASLPLAAPTEGSRPQVVLPPVKCGHLRFFAPSSLRGGPETSVLKSSEYRQASHAVSLRTHSLGAPARGNVRM